MTASTPGERRVGEFVLLEELGRGAHGVVYRARCEGQPGEFALKLLQHLNNPQRTERFRREARLAASLKHPGVVKVRGSGIEAGRPFIAYELVNGAQTLEDLLPTADLSTRLRWIQEAALALGHAHEQGVVHRDVKPENILIDESGRARVTDFGVATGRDLEPLTRSKELIGSPRFMSPEQVSAQRERIGPASDVWALGVVLYQALTGEVPFDGASMVELAGRVLEARPPRPRTLAPEVPAHLEAVTLRALARDPADRYPNGNALAAALIGGPPAANPLRFVLPAVLAALLLLGIGFVLAHGPSPQAEPPTPPGEPVPDHEDHDPELPPPPTPPPTGSEPRHSEETIALMERLTRLPAGSPESLALADRLLAEDPDSGSVRFVRGIIYMNHARTLQARDPTGFARFLDRGIAELEAATETARPCTDERLFHARGNVRFGQKRYEEAIADYERVYRPNGPLVANGNYGIALRYVKRFREATRVLEEVMARSPKPTWQLPYNLGGCYQSLKQPEQALRWFEKTEELLAAGQEAGHLRHMAPLRIAMMLRRLGRLDEAGAALVKAEGLAQTPSAGVACTRALISFDRGDIFQAEILVGEYYAEFADNKAYTPQVRALEIKLLVHDGRLDEARERLARYRADHPKSLAIDEAEQALRAAEAKR